VTARWCFVAAIAVAAGCGGAAPSTPPRAQGGTISDAAAPATPPPVADAVTQTAPPTSATTTETARQSGLVEHALPNAAETRDSGRTVARPDEAKSTESGREQRQLAAPIPIGPPTATTDRTTAVGVNRGTTSTGYSGPMTGTIRWSGLLNQDSTLILDGDQPSSGTQQGSLPGVPVLIQVLSKNVVVDEAPSAATGWRRVTLRSRIRQSSLILQWTVLP
jgi:hypothetical protein